MGTKMMLHRYSPVTKDWDTTEYVVDQVFLDTYGSLDPTIPTGYLYEPGKDLLKVYLNGQRLSSGGAYLETSDREIQLSLGTDEDGNPYLLQLKDELMIEIYKNRYESRGQETISGTDFYHLKKEIIDARKNLPTDTPYLSLDDRLDYLQKQIEAIHGGNADVDIDYEYNTRNQITREIITGEYQVVREFTYYEDDSPNLIGEMKTETIYSTDEAGGLTDQVTKSFMYDPATRRLLRTTVRG